MWECTPPVRLVGHFTGKYRRPIVEQIDGRTSITEGREIHFAWAGGFQPGEGHYYRIQTPDFLFKYENTQAGANHIHAVWRQFDGDFGEDLLRRHYETSRVARLAQAECRRHRKPGSGPK